MTKEKTGSFHRMYSIILSISIVLAGLCLMAGCLTIYFGGDHSYSREIVIETFSKISFPIYTCLVLIVGSILLDLFSPVESKRKQTKHIKDVETISSAPKTEYIIRYSFLFIGIIIFVYGLVSGGTLDVLTKAINICTECIGLG